MKWRPNIGLLVIVSIVAILLVSPAARAMGRALLVDGLRTFSKLASLHFH